MAEALAVAAGVIAIIQITDRVVQLCKFYIQNSPDASSDLYDILFETSALKTVFENLDFLRTCNAGAFTTVSTLCGKNGPIDRCYQSIVELEKLFPSDCLQTTGKRRSKKQKVNALWAALAWPLKESRAKKLLGDIARHKANISLAIATESIRDIKDIKAETSKVYELLTGVESQEVYRWLQSTIDPSPLHHRAQKQYEPGTGNWMLRSPEWTDWLDGKERCLWIHGIPGAGKTVLMSYLIEQVKQYCVQQQQNQPQQRKCVCVYYYCYFGHSRDETIPLLRWLLSQLCRQADCVPSKVYKMCKYGGEPSLVELLDALTDVLDLFEIVYLVVDAIDESIPRDDLLKVFRDLGTDFRFDKLQLLTSSREYIDIESAMESLSVSVSMTNPFVEEDIRLRVRSDLRSNSKFKRWPQALLDEAEDAVSTGAKGMFRWAVCQVDALQWLKCERDVVRRALQNLPKTLDETYDRIFLTVPEEEQVFVHHALQWIYFHNELYEGRGIPCETLVQLVAKSMAPLSADLLERFYDRDALRELCGCLINITMENYSTLEYGHSPPTLIVSFAHYTVREYLDSTRVSKTPVAYLTTCKKSLKQNFIATIFWEAYHIKPNEMWGMKYASDDEMETVSAVSDPTADAVADEFIAYCMASSLMLLEKRPDEISRQNELCSLAIDHFNPSKPHFDHMIHNFLPKVSEDCPQLYNWKDLRLFWEVTWHQEPSDIDGAHLLYLLLLEQSIGDQLTLPAKFLQGKETRNFLRSRLNFSKVVYVLRPGTTGKYTFDGSIIEVCAQLDAYQSESFKLLLDYGTGLFDPSKILLLFIGFHEHIESCIYPHETCLVDRLLKFGADPNVKGYKMTPLQIAVRCRDLEGVSRLLKAGACPNDTGDRDGMDWEEGTLMNRFNDLHNVSPLHICRTLVCISEGTVKLERESDLEEIEALLLQHGAREFLRDSSTGLESTTLQPIAPLSGTGGIPALFGQSPELTS